MKRENLIKQELFKTEREIKTNGFVYLVCQDKVDEYNQPTGEVESIKTIKALYHTSNAYKKRSTADSTTTYSEKQPMLLTTYEEIKDLLDKQNLFIVVDNTRYNLIAFENVQDYNIIYDISLEVVIDENQN